MTQVLVFAIERPYWQNILVKLAERGLQFPHAVVQYRYDYEYNAFFDKCQPKQIHGRAFYRIEDMAELLKDYSAPLSEAIIKGMENVERDFYTLTDRFCYFPKSFRYRKRLFRAGLRYWFGFFAANKIDKVFISCTPHNLSDFIGFNVARYIGIPTLQVYHTMINDYILLRDHYSSREIIPQDFLAGASEAEIIKYIKPEIYNAAFEQSNILKLVVSENDAALGQKGLNVKVKKKIKVNVLLKRLYRSLFRAPKFKGALGLNGLFSPTFRRILLVYDVIWKRIQRKKYDKLAIKPNLDDKYIYFALHLQPERTSTPEAEIFEDQLAALQILAAALPEGWKLYVKENPRQFDRKLNLFKGMHSRDVTDYFDILKIPNTYLIRQATPNKELINKAQIISTLAGSVGWEGLHAGKPVILFANAWYAACQSCFMVSSLTEAKAAVKNAVAKNTDDIKLDMLRYLAFIQDKLCLGDVGEAETLRVSKKTMEELEDGVVNAVLPMLKGK